MLHNYQHLLVHPSVLLSRLVISRVLRVYLRSCGVIGHCIALPSLVAPLVSLWMRVIAMVGLVPVTTPAAIWIEHMDGHLAEFKCIFRWSAVRNLPVLWQFVWEFLCLLQRPMHEDACLKLMLSAKN